jgi:hypothetical protein
MDGLRSAAIVLIGLILSACDGTLDSFSSTSTQASYATPGYYGSPIYAEGPYAEPGYVVPYSAPPAHGGFYSYEPGWGARPGWHEHQWEDRRDRRFENEDRRLHDQQRHDLSGLSPMPAQRRSFTPLAPAPPLARPQPSGGQADQNQKLLGQLGFRPNR